MNLKLFTDDDYRENVLKHIRGGSRLFFHPPATQSQMDDLGNTYSSDRLSRGNTQTVASSSEISKSNTSPLFRRSRLKQSLSPSVIPYAYMTSECFDAETLVEVCDV